MKLYGLKEEDILLQIQREYDIGYNSVEQVRESRRKDLKEFFDPDADESKIHIRTILQAYRMQMAISTKTRPEIEWIRRRPGDTERAKNANSVQKYDYEEMKMNIKEYLTESNMRKLGVGIQVSGPFDTISQHPTIDVVDTLSWIPDPKGGPTIEDHRWAGFEGKTSKWMMKKLGFENIEYACDSTMASQTENAYQDATNITPVVSDTTPNKEWDIYTHFFICEGKKYKAITNGNKTCLHAFYYLNPVTEEEKKDESKIPFPISLRYAFYDYGRPYGISTVDMLRDTQSALTKLFNLYLAQVFRAVFGGDRLIRAGDLEDPDSLNTPTIEGKDIPVKDTAGSLSDIVMEIPREQTNNLPPNLIEMLKRNAQENIGASSIQQGVVDEKSNTLGEQEMVQRNANIQFELEEKVMLWGHEFTWKNLWFRAYIANMKNAEEKEGSINTGYTRTFFVFKKDDFVGSSILSISLKGSSQVSQDKSNKSEKAMILQGLIASSQSEGEKRKYYRMWADLADFSDEQIDELITKTADEIGAEMKLAMINEGMPQGVEIDSMDDDHDVYIRYGTTADPGPLKDEFLKRRYEAKKILGKTLPMQSGVEQSGASASQAQLANGLVNSDKGLPSNGS